VFSVVVKTETLDRKFDTCAISSHDLEPALRKFGAHLRRKALAKYKAQDFEPLAPATVDKRAEKGIAGLEKKLHKDLRSAVRRARSKNAVPRGMLARLLGAKPVEDGTHLNTRGVRNRQSVLAAYQKRHGRSAGQGIYSEGLSGIYLADRVDLSPLTLKQMVSLTTRENRAVSKAIGKPILGNLPNSLKVEIEGTAVTLASRVHEHWTAAHNEGATVGKGAKLPKRETIALDADDLDVFAAILKEHHLEAFQET
jgi:hypothetical protein